MLLILKIILFLGYLIATSGFLFVGALAIWAKNFKIGIPLLILGLISGYGIYAVYIWYVQAIWVITAFFIVIGVLFIWYIAEPNLNIFERFLSPEALIKRGKKEKAAYKYQKMKKYKEAGELYEEMGMLESALWAYEEAEIWEKVAYLAEEVGRKEEDGDYYIRKAREIYKDKLSNYKKAAELTEVIAKDEGWYWREAAELYEKAGNSEKARECIEKSLEYYQKEAEEDGVFYDDVAEDYKKLGNIEKAKDAYMKYIEYCKEQSKDDQGWLRHVAEGYYSLYKLTGEEEYLKEGDKYLEVYKVEYVDKNIKDEGYKEELIEEIESYKR